MPNGRDSHANTLIAVAQSVSQENLAKLVASTNLMETRKGAPAKYVSGQSPEDFSIQRRFSFCIMPLQVGLDWLGSLIRLNCDTFVECFPDLDLGDLAPLLNQKSQPKHDLLVCLSTRSAYHLPVARKFVTSLRHRGLIGDGLAASVEMAVQEAFANSLVHGNLELHTDGHLSLDRFKELGEETERRLSSVQHGARAIVLTARRRKNGQVVIAINDQGHGFSPPDEKATADISRKDTTFGRGLPLIRSLCHSVNFRRGGRTVELIFDDHKSATSLQEPAFLRDAEVRLPASSDSVLNTAQNATILIADDTMLSREIIASYLRADGFTNLVFAKDGEDAIAQTKAHNPDLIILDIIMPKLDGYAVCKAVSD